MTAQAAEAGSVDILIAEDDALTRQSLRLLFEKAGYRCSEAEDGGRAVELARRRPRAAPSWTCRCRCWTASRSPVHCAGPAHAGRPHPLSDGAFGRGAREEASQAGIETYLTKPLEVSHLLQIVHNQLKLPDRLQASGLSLAAAREQLDCWESCGYGGLEVAYQEGQGFTVRCVRLPFSCETT